MSRTYLDFSTRGFILGGFGASQHYSGVFLLKCSKWADETSERGRVGQNISPIYEALSVGDNPSTDGHFLARIYVRLEPA